MMVCPLCSTECANSFFTSPPKQGGRRFYHCVTCDLIFVPPDFFLSPEEEKNRYLEHDNRLDDPNYRDFLSRLYSPLKQHIRKGSTGLDFGSGPVPVLAQIMRCDTLTIDTWDPFFSKDETVFQSLYDFITCTEVVEHFHHPRREFETLNDLLHPGGWMGIMTQVWEDKKEFPNWYYPRDPTHVCFFHANTMQWLAKQFQFSLSCEQPNVFLFHKPDSVID